MDMNNFPLLDAEAHRNCYAEFYEQLYFNLNSLVHELVSQFAVTDYDSDDPDKGYIDEKYTVATALLWAFKDKYKQTSADTLNNELDSITKLMCSFPGYCAKDEHYSVGAAETAVHNLRHSARGMMLHGKTLLAFCHSSCSIHPQRDITVSHRPIQHDLELLFSKRADLTQMPPYDCFATVYKNRRTLQDQSLDLPSDQGVFIGIAKHNSVIGNCVRDGSRIIATRQNLAFDPHSTRFTRNHSPLQPGKHVVILLKQQCKEARNTRFH